MYFVTIRNKKTNELITASVTGLANVLKLTNQFKTDSYSTLIQKRKV